MKAKLMNVISFILSVLLLSVSGLSADSVWPKPLNQVRLSRSLDLYQYAHHPLEYSRPQARALLGSWTHQPDFRKLDNSIVRCWLPLQTTSSRVLYLDIDKFHFKCIGSDSLILQRTIERHVAPSWLLFIAVAPSMHGTAVLPMFTLCCHSRIYMRLQAVQGFY